MLFGWYAHGMICDGEKDILKLAEEAKRNYSKGVGKTFNSASEAIKYLHSL